MSVERYVAALTNNISGGTQDAVFRELIGSLDQAYEACARLKTEGVPVVFGRFLLVCRKSMMSAAAQIAASQPEESVGTTRRAIECAKTCLAIKLNDENAAQWLAFQQRHDRWIRRDSKEKPKPFHVQFKCVREDEQAEALDTFLGILSDGYVHFTPEFYDSLDWDERKTDGGSEIFLHYFQRDRREVERHLLLLAGVHGRILQVFDRCSDWAFRNDPGTLAAIDRFWAVAKKFNDDYARRYGIVAEQDQSKLT